MRVSVILLVIGFIGLGGCQSILAPDPNNPPWYVTPQVGSHIEIHRRLTAPRGARINVQDGSLLPWDEVVQAEPYCRFHVSRTADQRRELLVIAPGEFTITKVYRRKDLVMALPVQVASLFTGTETHGSSSRTMATYMELSSDQQPEVSRFVCGRWADPFDYNHVRVNEIKHTLGNLGEILLAE